jgi:ABC-type bacteriocin/lantibiotic exporter with double-glycine peptidase domain
VDDAINGIEFWQKHHKYQSFSGWCGVAVVQMVLFACDINRPQWLIAKDILKSWWGVSHQLMLAYLSMYFKLVNYKNSATLKDIRYHLDNGHIVVVNWWDNIEDETVGDGHYSIVAEYHNKKITLVDPSKERNGFCELSSSEFLSHWYDYVDTRNKTYVAGWMLWVKPESKITKRGK